MDITPEVFIQDEKVMVGRDYSPGHNRLGSRQLNPLEPENKRGRQGGVGRAFATPTYNLHNQLKYTKYHYNESLKAKGRSSGLLSCLLEMGLCTVIQQYCKPVPEKYHKRSTIRRALFWQEQKRRRREQNP